ncbi:MAG: hypothetical protein US20_C0005G0037 [Candidatus Pacebacteria bacterium GW2011_GWF1_36_5]|nr:MAG: hypothetical protein US20_C0005G0037 [Candidatus Pacebacteria bacterium GW2011_GWF1_36_5]
MNQIPMHQENQDGHLTLINNNLKKCPKCDDYQEFLREEIRINDLILSPPRVMKQLCYCQKQQLEKQEKEKKQAKQKSLLMDRYKAAEIPPRFLNWDFSTIDDTENKKECQKYVDCFDMNLLTGNGLFMIGTKGRGKTTLAICILKELINNGYTAMIISFTEILNRITATYTPGSLIKQSQIIDDLLKFDFLILDDIGRESYTDKRMELAFEIVDKLNKNKKCIAITANPEMIEKLKDPARFKFSDEFKAILDRLDEMCKTVLTFNGTSFRS